MTIQDDIDAAHAAVNRLAGRLRDESDARVRAERALAEVGLVDESDPGEEDGSVGTYPARSIPPDDVLHADIDAWPGHACVQPDPFPEDGLWECPTCSRVWRTSKRIHEDAEAARRGRGVL